MNQPAKIREPAGCQNHPAIDRPHSGLIAFCETNLRYEKGIKAWIFVGPYLLGAFALEVAFTNRSGRTDSFTSWAGLIAYLILFPILWRRFLRFIGPTKTGFVAEQPTADNRSR